MDLDVPPPPADPRTAEQLRRAQHFESLGHLAGGIAHDFNNVLGVILGYIELAKMNLGGEDPKVARHLELALATLGRARSLADRLQDFSPRWRRPADAADLNETVQEVRDLLSETVDRRVALEVRLAPAVPPAPLSVDEARQVVNNLCLNAVEAMPDGGRVAIETFPLDAGPDNEHGLAEGRYVGLRVRDTGRGIPADLLPRIFDPYVTSHPGSRSGLGLWVVRSLVERAGGRVEAQRGARGTTLALWLPSELAVPEPQPGLLPADEAADGIDVLVVDDEPGVRDVTRSFLEMEGYRVLTAENGAEALDVLGRRPGAIRVVFLDNVLSDARGADLAWRIAGLPARPRIVLATGMTGSATPQTLPAGTRVLAKPYLHEDVTRLLRDDLLLEPRGPRAPS
jgi:CheY-like chemotaxis protein/two-component sensor histidine kinase